MAVRFAKKPDDGSKFAAVPTATPTEQVTPFPTETVNPTETATALPMVSPTDNPPVYDFTSERDELLTVTHAMLTGESFEDKPFTPSGSGVFFGFEGNALIAYAKAEIIEEPENVHYMLSNPIASFPYDLGTRARKSVSDYIRRNLNPAFTDDDNLQLFGFMGENYIVFTGEPFHGYQASAIFFTEDGTEWTEIRSFEGYPMQLTGGAMLSENVGYLCYMDRSLMQSAVYTPRTLTVYMTVNGGETWEDIGLVIPEEYEGMIAPPSAALSPRFDGEHGVIPVTHSMFNSDTGEFESHTAWFETNDGGKTWEFHAPQSELISTSA